MRRRVRWKASYKRAQQRKEGLGHPDAQDGHSNARNRRYRHRDPRQSRQQF